MYTVTFTRDQMNEVEMALMNYRYFLEEKAVKAFDRGDSVGHAYFTQRRTSLFNAERSCDLVHYQEEKA